MNSNLSAFRLKWLLVTVGMGSFLATMSTSIVNTILPAIGEELHISLVQSEWVILLYLLVNSLLMLPAGRLSDVLGHRRLFLSGFLVYTVAALICGGAGSLGVLLAGRAVLAVGGSLMMAAGPVILTNAFPPDQRGKVLGLTGIMTYSGMLLGPSIGGWLTHLVSWHAAFYVICPFSLAGFLAAVWATPKIAASARASVDAVGMASYMAAVSSLVLLCNTHALGASGASWLPPVLAAVLLVSGGVFVRNSLRHADPLIHFSLFRIRNFSLGTLGAILNYMCNYLIFFLVPFYCDRALHLNPAQIGTWLTVMPLVLVISSPLAGSLSDRIGARPLAVAGMAFATVALAWFALLLRAGTAHPDAVVLGGLVLAGLGSGVFVAPNNSAIFGSVSAERRGVASGTLATARYIGQMAGITLGGNALSLLLRHYAGLPSGDAFASAFAVVMGLGVLFGVAGVVCSAAMRGGARAPRA